MYRQKIIPTPMTKNQFCSQFFCPSSSTSYSEMRSTATSGRPCVDCNRLGEKQMWLAGQIETPWLAHAPGCDIRHQERNNTNPSVAIPCIEHQSAWQKGSNDARIERPVSEQQLRPSHPHDPRLFGWLPSPTRFQRHLHLSEFTTQFLINSRLSS